MRERPTREQCLAWDRADPLAPVRERFTLPNGVIYLDGNSLGALSRSARARLVEAVDGEWSEGLVRSWNEAGWIGKPVAAGERIASLIGAGPGQVVVGDSTSVNLYQVIVAAARMRPGRPVVLVERGAFPTDIYIAHGAAGALVDVRVELIDDAESLEVGDDVAAVVLGHVDFRTGRMLDLPRLTARIHRAGALAIWDLCHSAGAVPIALDEADADFAVGCTYKYLNGGPGSPAFLYAAQRHQADSHPPLTGWHGHAAPFEFSTDYRPAPGIERFRVGTPSVLSMAALEGALDVWRDVDLAEVRAKSLRLTSLFRDLLAGTGLLCVTPSEDARRGSQVSLSHPNAYEIVRALIERGVIGDFRAPDVLRFGFTPLYLRYVDAYDAAAALRDVLDSSVYREPRFSERTPVT